LGVDLKFTEGKKYFYGSGIGNLSPYKVFYTHYMTGLKILKKAGIKVFSCSPVSTLNEHIPYVDLNTLIPVMPIFVSHFTKDTPYEKEVLNLIKSLKRHHLDYDVEGISSLGTWRANSNWCAWQVQAMLEKYKPRSILRLDADARVQRYPELFRNFNADIGACIWKESMLKRHEPDGEFMGGTLFFDNNDRTKAAVDEWVQACKEAASMGKHERKYRNGDLLYKIVKKRRAAKQLIFKEMPLEYCKIFNFAMGRVSKPIIEHFQASRRFKKVINNA
jgi:hypothetical protein